MAKWGLWTAHRYVWAGAAVPRRIGPDGKPLRRPWRIRSEEAVAEATRIRATRRQARWPKVLGWAFIGMALAVALNPMTWVQSPPSVSAHGESVPQPPGSSIAISAPHFVEIAGAFRWRDRDVTGPFQLVILGDDYREAARFDGIEASPYRPEGPGQEALVAGQTYAAYLLATDEGRMVKSPLVSFVWQ